MDLDHSTLSLPFPKNVDHYQFGLRPYNLLICVYRIEGDFLIIRNPCIPIIFIEGCFMNMNL